MKPSEQRGTASQRKGMRQMLVVILCMGLLGSVLLGLVGSRAAAPVYFAAGLALFLWLLAYFTLPLIEREP